MNSSPFLLAGTVQHHVKTSDIDITQDILRDFYVDNLISGTDTTEEANKFYTETKRVFNNASMNPREWFSNDPVVLEKIKEVDRGQSTKTKVLGLEWDTVSDTLCVSGFAESCKEVTTKRLILKNLAKTFDPCGYFSAVIVKGKIVMQQIWKESFQWDKKLPDKLLDEWSDIANDLAKIPDFKIPRCLLPLGPHPGNFQLHCFCDASKKAYSAIVYLRIQQTGAVFTKFVMAKSRVAPLKVLSIPRLELMAVLIGARLCSFVEKQLHIPITERVIWSDSQCVLHWIIKDTVSTTFVKNRVREIKSQNDAEFRYVPTNVNPADLSSRGCSYQTLSNSTLWWSGPTFLLSDRSKWPKNIDPCAELNPESSNDDCQNKVTAHVNTNQESPQGHIIDYSRFSKVGRLHRSVAWALRFIHNVRNKEKRHGALTSEEIVAAEAVCIGDIQKNDLPEFTTQTKPSIFKNLAVYKDGNGILRCAGRLQFADTLESVKFSILLPKNNHYSNLVITSCHKTLFHSGVPHTLSQVRQRFWIPQGRSQVKKAIRTCHFCRRRRGGPFRAPDFPPLPEFRLKKQKAFSTVGLDYMGPLFIKAKPEQTEQKVWICLYTCAVTRAVHLDVVDQLSTEQCLLSLRRFIAARGTPTLIISDNAKQFHAAYRFLKSDKVIDYTASKGIAWKFITEMSPWMGGFYERMIAIVKRCLKNNLDSRCVSLCELQTVLAEIQTVVNSRPLVYVDSDEPDNVITPAHFIGGPFPSLIHHSHDGDEYQPPNVTGNQLVQNYKRLQNLLDNFWKQFHNQYLLGLRDNRMCHNQTRTNNTPAKLGSLVVIKDSTPRNLWKMGKIVALKHSNDGHCRSATVELPNKKQLNRPIKHLYPLELQVQSTLQDPPLAKDEPRKDKKRQPQRRCAKMSAVKTKDILTKESGSESDEN